MLGGAPVPLDHSLAIHSWVEQADVHGTKEYFSLLQDGTEQPFAW